MQDIRSVLEPSPKGSVKVREIGLALGLSEKSDALKEKIRTLLAEAGVRDIEFKNISGYWTLKKFALIPPPAPSQPASSPVEVEAERLTGTAIKIAIEAAKSMLRKEIQDAAALAAVLADEQAVRKWYEQDQIVGCERIRLIANMENEKRMRMEAQKTLEAERIRLTNEVNYERRLRQEAEKKLQEVASEVSARAGWAIYCRTAGVEGLVGEAKERDIAGELERQRMECEKYALRAGLTLIADQTAFTDTCSPYEPGRNRPGLCALQESAAAGIVCEDRRRLGNEAEYHGRLVRMGLELRTVKEA
jgi:hypothetical protein